jgi:hypothetical protein
LFFPFHKDLQTIVALVGNSKVDRGKIFEKSQK